MPAPITHCRPCRVLLGWGFSTPRLTLRTAPVQSSFVPLSISPNPTSLLAPTPLPSWFRRPLCWSLTESLRFQIRCSFLQFPDTPHSPTRFPSSLRMPQSPQGESTGDLGLPIKHHQTLRSPLCQGVHLGRNPVCYYAERGLSVLPLSYPNSGYTP